MLCVVLITTSHLTLSSAAMQERVFENKTRKDVHFKNEKWVREFELELTNTGEKPMYNVFLDLITDVEMDGRPFVLAFNMDGLNQVIL